MKGVSIICYVHKGKPNLRAFQQQALNQEFARNEGKRVKIVVVRAYKTRTDQQNRYYWVLMTIMGSHCGYTKDEMHEAMKKKFLDEKDIVLGKQKMKIPPTTTKLKVMQFWSYVDEIREWAAKSPDLPIEEDPGLGLVLPEPTKDDGYVLEEIM